MRGNAGTDNRMTSSWAFTGLQHKPLQRRWKCSVRQALMPGWVTAASKWLKSGRSISRHDGCAWGTSPFVIITKAKFVPWCWNHQWNNCFSKYFCNQTAVEWLPHQTWVWQTEWNLTNSQKYERDNTSYTMPSWPFPLKSPVNLFEEIKLSHWGQRTIKTVHL